MKKKRWDGVWIAVLVLIGGVSLVTTKQEKNLSEVLEQTLKGTEMETKIEKEIETEIEAEKEIDWTDEIFTGENIFISYPVFSFKENKNVDQINLQIQEDALRILEHFDVNIESDTLDITYELADITKDWISIVYCGSYYRADASYSTAVKYTSNLSLKDGTHLQIAQVDSVKLLAEKILEGKYRVIGEDEELKEAVQNLVTEIGKEKFVQYLEAADFGMESYEAYPEWFSFWSTIEGETQISVVMPVGHTLGDYAVLEVFSESLD